MAAKTDFSSYKNYGWPLWKEYIYSQVLAEGTITQAEIEMTSLSRKLEKFLKLADFLKLQAKNFDEINCFISNIQRFTDDKDDIATVYIKMDKFEQFNVCINTKNDFKVQEMAFKVHNLSYQRRKVLVNALRKFTGLDSHIRNAQAIHRAHNFEIKKL